MVSFHFEEERLSLELLRNMHVKLRTVFVVVTAAMVVLIGIACATSILLHEKEDHVAFVVEKQFKNVTYMDYSNLQRIVSKALDPYWPYYGFNSHDALYAAYSEDDLDEFLDFARKYPFAPYSLENHDCDDFAKELHGFERMWYSRKDAAPYGSTFGVIIGDLRTLDDPPGQERGHAMNIVVLHDLSVWGVEPQNLRKFKFPRDWQNTTRVDFVWI